MRNQVFRVERGWRPDVQDVIILITSGRAEIEGDASVAEEVIILDKNYIIPLKLF